MSEQPPVQIRYRVNVTGRLPDPGGKHRDSLDQTLELIVTGNDVYDLLGDVKLKAVGMRDYLFGALEERGGRAYRMKKP